MEIDILSRVLFRDQLLIVLDKPCGIPVHAGPSSGESLEDFFPQLMFGYKETPKLAHRLDRDTSGCLTLGRNTRALKKLGKLFESGRISKTYWAITNAAPPQDSGTIDTPLLKVKRPKGWSMEPAPRGTAGAQDAVTTYKVLKHLEGGHCFLELTPRTGRTHQIRVHLQSLGCPIVNDWLYGPAAERPETFLPLHLHARSIEIPIYTDKPPVCITAEPPAHMRALLGA